MLISKIKAILIGLTLLCAANGTVCPSGSSLIPNCLSCTTVNSNIVCNSCINGYYLVSTTCVSCSSVLPNCLSCSLNIANQPACFICQSGYGLLNGACQNCSAISGCANCQVVNYNLQCTTCSANLVLYSAQMQCVPCTITNCNNCSVNNAGNFTCSSCINGYYLSSNLCSPCAAAISNCASCLYDRNGKLICSLCVSTWLYLLNNSCSANCSKGGYSACSTCQMVSLTANTMICTSCLSGYYLDTGINNCLSCTQALTGCLSCQMDSTSSDNATVNVVACIACSSNYFLSSNPPSCVLCSTVKENCQTCNFDFATQSGTCKSCIPGYYLNSTDLVCYSCTSSAFITPVYPAGSCAVCAMNGTNTVCTRCMDGFFLAGGSCKTCGNFMGNCSTCSYNASFACLTCNSGFIINAVGQCSSCSSLYANCNFCNAVECTDCLPGYYTINNKQCLINCAVTNCNQCASKNNAKCAICSTGYSITSQFTCTMIGCAAPLSFNGVACICPYQSYYVQAGNTCQPCSDNYCMICLNNQCSQCLDGFFLQSTSCSRCMSNCQYCNSTTYCFLCADGFVFKNGQCQAYTQIVYGGIGVTLNANFYQLCGMGCSQCTTTGCLSCQQGFFLNESNCYFCPTNCRFCEINITTTQTTDPDTNQTTNTLTSTVVCLDCQSGMALLNQACSKCIDPNCVKCDYNTYFCILCAITYTADSNGLCKPCASNCNFCDMGGAGTCDDDSCFLGYAKFNASSCIRCLNGCSSCEGTYPFTCIGCLVGSYSVTTGNASTCLNCDYGCDKCTGPNNCLSCNPFFNLANGICSPLCSLPCVSCSLSTNKSQICSSCLQGYSVSNGSCVADFSCMAAKICEFCPLGYFSYKGSCYTCASNCAQCIFEPNDPAFVISGNNYISYLTCTQCSNGFYLDVLTNCLNCPYNCSYCLSSNQCSKCLPSYFLQYKLLNGVNGLNYSVGTCQSCSAGCYQCEVQPNRCISCRPSFHLNGFICRSNNNVTFRYTLIPSNNASDSGMFMSIVSNIAQVYTQIANSFGSIYANKQYLIMINSITNGSVIIDGSADIDNSSSDASSTYYSISSNMQQITTVKGYKVASSSISANGFTPTPPTTTSTSNNILLYIIIGSAIVVIAVIVIIICLCKRCKKKQNIETEEQVTTTQKAQTEQNEPATSKNMLKSEELYPKSSARVQDQFSNHPKNKSKRQKKIQEVSHISGNKTVVQQQAPQRRSIHLVPTVVQEQETSKSKSKSKGKSNTNSNNKNKSKPKTSKHIPQSHIPQQSQKYQSAKTIQIPTRDFPQKSKAEQISRYRQIEHLRNDTNLAEDEKTQKYVREKQSKKQSNSISKKYIPNSNSHYI